MGLIDGLVAGIVLFAFFYVIFLRLKETKPQVADGISSLFKFGELYKHPEGYLDKERREQVWTEHRAGI